MNSIELVQPQFQTGLKRSLREINHASWEDVGMNVVLGVSETGLPARFLAGFVPAFSLLEALVERKQVSPELRIFVPLHLASQCNNVPENLGNDCLQQGFVFIQKFQKIFHPNIRWFLDIDRPFTQEATSLLTNLSQRIIDDPLLTEHWHQAFEAAQKRGSKDSALIYTPHHVFGWHDAWQPKLFFERLPKSVTLNCFSQSEIKFQEIRKKIMSVITDVRPELVVHGQHLDLITSRCPGPHYLITKRNGNQEPTLSDLMLAGFEKTKNELTSLLSDGFQTALKDLESINTHIEECRKADEALPNIEDFIQEVNFASS